MAQDAAGADVPDEMKEDFNWLRRDARGSTYISYSPFSNLPSTSFEFGAEGCAASCNEGGEILNLSAPSKKDGLILVRGDFETSLYSSVARAQSLFGGPSTFGFEVSTDREKYDKGNPGHSDEGSSFKLGEPIERGCFNYRWPLNEYHLYFNEGDPDDSHQSKPPQAGAANAAQPHLYPHPLSAEDQERPQIVGTCVMFSFIKDCILYQVIRIEQANRQDSIPSEQKRKFNVDSQIVLTIGSPVWFVSFATKDRVDGEPFRENGEVINLSSRKCMRFLDTSRAAGLEAKVYQLDSKKQVGDQLLDLFISPIEADSGALLGETYPYQGEVPAYNAFGRFTANPDLEDREHVTFLAAIRLTEVPSLRQKLEIQGEDLYSEQLKAWVTAKPRPLPIEDALKLWPEEELDWPKIPTSQEVYDYVGVDPRSKNATGAMWETIFLERERKIDSPSDLVEVRLIGRSLEKVLLVDIIPVPGSSDSDSQQDAHPADGGPEGSSGNAESSSSSDAAVGGPTHMAQSSETDRLAERKQQAGSNGAEQGRLGYETKDVIEDEEDATRMDSGEGEGVASGGEISSTGDIKGKGKGLDLPDHRPGIDKSPSKPDADNWILLKPRWEAVMISNIFHWPNVDLKALFWKARFLVKAYSFLSQVRADCAPLSAGGLRRAETSNFQGTMHGHLAHDHPNMNVVSADTYSPYKDLELDHTDINEMYETADFQCTRIQAAIVGIVRYIVEALLRPGRSGERTLMPDNFVPGESNYYYVMMTLWYIIRNHRDRRLRKRLIEWDEVVGTFPHLPPAALPPLFDPERLPLDNFRYHKDVRDKIPLLMWYHYASVLSLCENHILPEWFKTPDLKAKVLKLSKVAKVAAAAKLSANQPYTPGDELTDRLALLATELGLETMSGSHGTVTSLTIRRLKQRRWTSCVNPGQHSVEEDGPTSGPWEIHALCHHSRLATFGLEDLDSELFQKVIDNTDDFDRYKNRVSNFLNNEATLVPSWERDHLKALQSWLRSEASSVVASTLLDLRQKIMRAKRPQPATEPTFLSEKSRTGTKRYKPRFTNKQKPPLALKEYVENTEKSLGSLCFSIKYLTETLTWEPLRGSVSVSDIVAMGRTTKDGQRVLADPTGSHIEACIRHYYGVRVPKTLENVKMPGDTHPEGVPRHRDVGGRKPAGNKTDDNRMEHHPGHESAVVSDKAVIRLLSDSLVDKLVQHRFVIITKLSERLLTLLLYVLHRETSAALTNHVLSLSRYSCQRGQTWVASITLSSWVSQKDEEELEKADKPDETGPRPFVVDPTLNLQDKLILPKYESEKAHNKDASDADQEAPIQLPKDLQKVEVYQRDNVTNKRIGVELPKSPLKLTISSLVLSTNDFGDFSKCAIVSRTADRDRLARLVRESREVWQRFVHQPRTARCLVFLLALAALCEMITNQYKKAIKQFVSLLNLDDIFLDDAFKESHQSVDQFKLGLWSLEALSKIQNSLSESLESIRRARADLVEQIEEAGRTTKRSDVLERMCQEYLGMFESSLADLTAENESLAHRISLSSRYKDALSALLTLRDSRTSIEQNGTVERLTYLTIAYLPITLMAAVLAIPERNQSLFSSMGLNEFLYTIVVVSLFTYFLAVYVKFFLSGVVFVFVTLWHFFRYPPLDPGKEKNTKSKETRHWELSRPGQRNLWVEIDKLFTKEPALPLSHSGIFVVLMQLSPQWQSNLARLAGPTGDRECYRVYSTRDAISSRGAAMASNSSHPRQTLLVLGTTVLGAVVQTQYTCTKASVVAKAAATAVKLSSTSKVAGKTFSRFVQICLENTDYDVAISDYNLAYLASQGISLTNYYAITHPSQPNYVVAAGLSTHGVDSDSFTGIGYSVKTIVDLLEDAGVSWSLYEEDMPFSGFEAN
ncbi:hypothetical protein GQ53DRAFT_877592 [Thozetella sp. PMI_491]|nr:hypothetical protein GQ53DRAFT_877592 [Thozetella sp. PMI_491]